MAPILFGDRINTASMVGTWLGSLFTGIGLIAVISQLRAYLDNRSGRRLFLLQKSAGKYAALIPRELPDKGLAEGFLPGFTGWVQNAYRKDFNTSLTHADRSLGGLSGWSQLFAHCGISPEMLLTHGGSGAYMYPTATGKTHPKPVLQADCLADEGRISYGFSRYEFAALMIITGNFLESFSLHKGGVSVKYLGTVLMSDAEPVPFAQLARFDPHEGNQSLAATGELSRLVSTLPIRRSINYALGILETSVLGGKRYIIPSKHMEVTDGTLGHPQWEKSPQVSHLRDIRYALEQTVATSGEVIMGYSNHDSAYSTALQSAAQNVCQSASNNDRRELLAIELGIAVAALQPWAVFPVLQPHFVSAFAALLLPFIGEPQENVGKLQELLVTRCRRPTEGWENTTQQAEGLTYSGDIKTEFFCHSANSCLRYYKAMELVFETCNIKLHRVRVTLAADVSARCMGTSDGQVHMRLRTLLNSGSAIPAAPKWAVTIYAAYVYAWLCDSVRMPDVVFDRFKRRVFLA